MKSPEKKDIIDSLMKMNKYMTIPSIPTRKQAYGYTETKDNELLLNKVPLL